ncbi:PIN-like domain-containing protein [Aminobacterium sp. MB27-C1]|uniref:PIN-like domain-containing protein n=1 Tax=Aminobacterium sp. MB27-C1 TaxID=3070661 RepID=UPI0027DB6044|nr:PIN-like domain-containing protein [Aminobacterium sp. MB27-C1]WMI72159.1 PIN-like domain-containing protein [Aminobacterium sp. MB27-C1]
MDSHCEEMITQINQEKERHPSLSEKDGILDRILFDFDTKVGAELSEKEKEENVKEAKLRFEQKIPPGYMDSKKDNGNKYGDYFIWEEIISEAKERKMPVMFISDDKKDDWWEKGEKSKKIGPRYELIKELKDLSGQRFYMSSMENFLEKSKEYLDISISDKSVTNVRDVTIAEVLAVRNKLAHSTSLHNDLMQEFNSLNSKECFQNMEKLNELEPYSEEASQSKRLLNELNRYHKERSQSKRLLNKSNRSSQECLQFLKLLNKLNHNSEE